MFNSYQLWNANSTQIRPDQEVYSRFNIASRGGKISLDYNTTMPPNVPYVSTRTYDLAIRVEVEGGNYMFKQVRIIQHICGGQTIRNLFPNGQELFSNPIEALAYPTQTVFYTKYFISNDTDCPVTNYEVDINTDEFNTLSSYDTIVPDDFETIEAYNAERAKYISVNSTAQTITFTAFAVNQVSVKVIATCADGDNYSVAQIMWRVYCNSKSTEVTLTPPINGVEKVFYKARYADESPNETFLTDEEVVNMFTNKDDRCPVREYVPIPGMPGNPWMFSNDDFKYMLNLDTRDSPGFMFNRNFYHSNESSLVLKERYPITLQAIAEGGASTIKLLIATVNVCGQEQTVGVADLMQDLYEYSLEDPYKYFTSDERLQTFVEIKDIYLNSRDTYFGRYIMLKPQFYSTEEECQVIKFSLWTSANTADPTASVPATSDQMRNYMIVNDQFGDDFLYLDPQTTGQFHFYVKGETISG